MTLESRGFFIIGDDAYSLDSPDMEPSLLTSMVPLWTNLGSIYFNYFSSCEEVELEEDEAFY